MSLCCTICPTAGCTEYISSRTTLSALTGPALVPQATYLRARRGLQLWFSFRFGFQFGLGLGSDTCQKAAKQGPKT